jgi:hypothetical protein
MPNVCTHPSSDSIATCYGLGGARIVSPVGARHSALLQTIPGARLASCTTGTRSFPAGKWQGHGVDHPPPSAAEIFYSYTFTPPLGLCGLF